MIFQTFQGLVEVETLTKKKVCVCACACMLFAWFRLVSPKGYRLTEKNTSVLVGTLGL